jgi:UPF0755 protein
MEENEGRPTHYALRITHYIIFSISVSSIVAILIVMGYLSPMNRSAKPKRFDVPPGATANSIAKRLAREKLIRNPSLFRWAIRLSGASRDLKAGSYHLSASMSPLQIIENLRSGSVLLRRFVVPEGLTLAQIGELWETEGFGTVEAFDRVARDPRWREMYDIDGETLEGYLFPNTYQVADGTPIERLIEMMLDEFDRRWTLALSEEAESLGFSTHEIITLASIIEKEAQADDERPIISAVYHNRLRRGWRLDADPTVLYALGNPKRRLTLADLKVNSPYNTYLHRGMPPGPICNPGLASILAALRPAQASYLYFVAIGGGRHYFSKTLAEHKRMIRKIRRDVH